MGSNLLNAFGIIGIVGLMVLPVHPVLLDILLTFNITFGLIILLVTIYVKEPLEFSVFPSRGISQRLNAMPRRWGWSAEG